MYERQKLNGTTINFPALRRATLAILVARRGEITIWPQWSTGNWSPNIDGLGSGWTLELFQQELMPGLVDNMLKNLQPNKRERPRHPLAHERGVLLEMWQPTGVAWAIGYWLKIDAPSAVTSNTGNSPCQ